jgi:predicted transcriptional regulator
MNHRIAVTRKSCGIECLDGQEQGDDKRCEFYVQICERSRVEAAKQASQLLETAEILCNEDSKISQRKGKVFKKLAPQIEKHVFDGLQRDICVNLWEEAAEHVYGTIAN